MKLDIREVIEIIESEKRVLNVIIKGVENSTDLEDQDRLLTRYNERVRQCNTLILAFSYLLENKEVQ